MPDRRVDLREFGGRMTQLAGVILTLLVFGTTGLAVTEDVGVWAAFNWSVDIIATIGTFDPPATTAGQVVKLVLVITGVGTLFYALVTIVEFFVAGHLGELLGERRQQRMTDNLTDHTIICGYGRVGRQVARDLRGTGHECVVIDPDVAAVEAAKQQGVHALTGRASDDELLRRAGIERARALLACVDSDAENIFVTLSARELRGDDLLVVARASAEDAEKKLRRAGADRVISPYKSSGSEMARLALHPQISGVVDVSSDYRLDEIDVPAGCRGVGMRIEQISIEARVVGLRREGRFVPQPTGRTELLAGDVVVAMGPSTAMEELEALFDVERGKARD